jgi:hypothetical protein
MAERAFHAIRAFRFRQGVQPIGLTSIRTPARELIQRPFFLWQGNGRRYGPKASLMQRQRSTPVGASSIGFQPGGISFMPLASLFQLSIAPTLKQEVAPLNVSGETSPYLSELFELRLSERR